MKLISFNVNGLRACINKGFFDFLAQNSPDALCLQEIKMTEDQLDTESAEALLDYETYFYSADKKGYSGTAVFLKDKGSLNNPISVTKGLNNDFDGEGRVITTEFSNFYLVNVYTPNSKQKLERLEYRQNWEDMFREYLISLDKLKPVILCGDLNVAHNEIDLKNPKQNRKNAGFTDEERGKFSALLDAGFTDSFRYLYPEKEGVYSWWSYRFNARANNAGWRIDYFLVSNRIAKNIKDAQILTDVFGSDHCPVLLEIDF